MASIVSHVFMPCHHVSDVKVQFNYAPYVKDLYKCALQRLMAADIDQEVKERAISCM